MRKNTWDMERERISLLFMLGIALTNLDSKLHESNPGFEFNDHVTPLGDEIVLTKNVNSAFIGTGLKSILDEVKNRNNNNSWNDN